MQPNARVPNLKFWIANYEILSVLGMWVRLHEDHNYVGLHIAVPADGEQDVKVTAIDKQSLLLLHKTMPAVHSIMRDYPDCLSLVIDWDGVRMAVEIDLVKPFQMLYVKSRCST